MSRDYEILYIVRPDLDEEHLNAAVASVTKLIENLGGTTQKTDVWGRRRLAYEVRHLREGQYVLTDFQIEPARVPEMESTLKISDTVFRHLIVRKPEPAKERPAAKRKRIAAAEAAAAEAEAAPAEVTTPAEAATPAEPPPPVEAPPPAEAPVPVEAPAPEAEPLPAEASPGPQVESAAPEAPAPEPAPAAPSQAPARPAPKRVANEPPAEEAES